MAYQSPYGRGGGVTFQPPAGIAALIAQDRQKAAEGFAALGAIGGAVGAGAIGGFQGAASPETFGAGTSAGSGAVQGFFQNYQNAMGDQNSGIGALMGGGRGGAGGMGGGGGGGNFKQLQLAGKTADSFRQMLQSREMRETGQESRMLGVSDDQWKTMGALEKFSTVGAMFEAQQAKTAELAYRKGLQDFQQAQQEQNARSAFAQAVKAGELQLAPNGQPSLAMKPTPLTGAQQVQAAQASGMSPRDVTEVAQTNYYLQRAAEQASLGDATPLPFSVNGIEGVYSPRTGAIHQRPTAAAPKPVADPRQRSFQADLTAALADEAKAIGALSAAKPEASNYNSLAKAATAATTRRKRAEAKLAGPPTVAANVPPDHAAYLRAHPEKRASFEATYGKEAAAAILGD